MDNKLYINSGMIVEFIPELNIVKTSYSAFVPDNLLKEGLLKAIDIGIVNSCKYLIFDNTNFKGATSSMQKWLSENYFKEMVNSGISKCALIKSKDKFANYSVDSVLPVGRQMIQMEIFDTLEDALEWIKH